MHFYEFTKQHEGTEKFPYEAIDLAYFIHNEISKLNLAMKNIIRVTKTSRLSQNLSRLILRRIRLKMYNLLQWL